ncbi:topoisomerase DNA-binding C4 zinc finger domain-containing protein [Pseudomonas sp. PDM16]|uniref:topoisomerase DNA-binding C4 zinc finger domain-containing protein n=1 Tax=Pseudomonas sp. PDM16 TaxID=2769292 RepID=UPI00177FDB0D|nr:topoisomerase DNA-binding C4 zinc finger domain-containing protein [Pseudomonas sp. PDM16]MBD9416995.1 topoisomerase DNA-binding C4 zinc finger domain-containing protein [Pseudomonas sp. PDM16]
MIERHLKKFTAAVFILTLILLKLIIGPVTCNSGWKSPSIGRSGACSHHGGVAGWKGSLPILLSGGAALWFFISFSPKSTPPRVTTTSAELPSGTNSTQPVTPPTPNSERKSQNIVTCPRCSSLMSLRTAKKGKNPGSKFWGCSKYPRCKGTRSYTPEQGV